MKREGLSPCIAPMKNDMSTRLRNLRVSRSFHIPPLRPFETEILTQNENIDALATLNSGWVSKAVSLSRAKKVILDIDSSESPVHGNQEGSAYNGHFESTCYHPLFCFNNYGIARGRS